MRTIPSRSGFDVTWHMRQLCLDLTSRLAELHHIDIDRVAFSCSQTRKRTEYGLWASLTPMRFRGGEPTEVSDGRVYACQRLLNSGGVEMLYILTLYLPRFLNLSTNDKLVTVLHELWHISPNFDGDIRRHPGRCYVHTSSEREYDAQMEVLAEKWLALKPSRVTYALLDLSFSQLQRHFGHVIGSRVPRPRIVPIDSADVS